MGMTCISNVLFKIQTLIKFITNIVLIIIFKYYVHSDLWEPLGLPLMVELNISYQ